jgi:hypothetical protein
VERVEGVHTAHAAWAKELDRLTIEATVHPIIAAEFATVTIVHPPGFESYEFLEENLAVAPPEQERVVLVVMSLCM